MDKKNLTQKENQMPTYEWKCEECETSVLIFRSIANYETPPDKEEATCSHSLQRNIIGASIFRASYVDGQRMSSSSAEGRAYQDLAMAAKLKIDKADMRYNTDDYKEISKSIRRLEGKKPLPEKKK